MVVVTKGVRVWRNLNLQAFLKGGGELFFGSYQETIIYWLKLRELYRIFEFADIWKPWTTLVTQGPWDRTWYYTYYNIDFFALEFEINVGAKYLCVN